MDFESDDEEFPPPRDIDTTSTSTFGVSQLPDRTISLQEPPSPRTARKRSAEELYLSPDRPRHSTTPLKTPPRPSLSRRSAMDNATTFDQFGEMASQAPTSVDGLRSSIEQTQAIVQSHTFIDSVNAYQQHLEADFKDHENELKSRDKTDELEDLDWDDLENRYQNEIASKIADEQQIMDDVHRRFEQFLLWMKVSGERENERAVKRLRTRMAFVQHSENTLAERQDHYGKVLTAFQNAMALLGNA